MQAFQVLQYLLILIISLTTFIEAQDKDYYNKPGCNSSCGDLWISYPFGIGRNCSANEWYTIDCNTYTPYLPALNNVEVFAIDTSTQRVTVKTSEFKADCKNPVINSKLVLGANHLKSPFRVSGSRNSFVVDGCGYGSLMEENGTIVTGCSTTCNREHIGGDQRYSCLGVDGCCQTALPHDLESFTLNRTGLLERPDGNRTCGSAFLVDTLYLDFPSQIIQGGLNFVPISLSWNERFDINVTRCNETCGGVSLAYPFGIEKNCSMSDWFHVDCKSSTPYLSAFDNMEVLDFDEEKETVTVNVSMNSDCDNPVQDSSLVLSNTPFRFSKSDNMFVVEGCGSASVMVNGNIVSGCSTTCGNYTVSDTNNCFGVGCCQTTIPRDLGLFTLDLTGLAKDAGIGKCASAFLVDKNSFMEGRFSRQFVPMTFKWHEIREPYAKACYLCESEEGRCSIYADDEGSSMMCIPLESNKKPIGIILGVSISMGLVFLTVISYALFKLIKKTKAKKRKQRCFKRNGGLLLKQQQETHTGLVDKTILFTSDELEKATDHFSESRILGRGGQGTVYKGMLADGRIVAIKKSKVVDENQLEQFINEVVILSQVNHRNVVKLLGCCLETEVPLLVSEFISNGTLYDLIQDKTGEFSFTLNKRLQIATEVAGALSYLHSATSIPIYHRDIKTTNILLDEKYRAKVSDFGTSRFVSIDQTHLTTLVKGTFGYLDPEYFQSSQFTEKSDVYSFGVVLLELLTREKPISSTRFGESRNLVAHFMLAMEEDRLMSIFDGMVVGEGSMTELLAVANLAMRCLNFNGKNRPTMKEVSIELEGIRSSHVASMVQTNIGFVKHYEDLPLTYSMSTSTSMSYDYNPSG